jgi:hypothetical protein
MVESASLPLVSYDFLEGALQRFEPDGYHLVTFDNEFFNIHASTKFILQ